MPSSTARCLRLGVHVTDIVGMAADTATGGYWLVGSDGGVYAFDAPFDGSVPGLGQHVTQHRGHRRHC